jgi:hypothetical protein
MNSGLVTYPPAGKCDGELVSVLPLRFSTAPPQVLFQSEFISMLLAEIKTGQRLYFSKLRLSLITVVSGTVRMQGPNGSFVSHPSCGIRLGHGEDWKIYALTDSVVSLLIAKGS